MVDLLIIDPQNDFCTKGGSLYLGEGVENDVANMVKLINHFAISADSITVSLDTHHMFDISHPSYWVNYSPDAEDNDENSPVPPRVKPGTVITYEDFARGKYATSFVDNMNHAETYLMGLKNSGKYEHRIFPPHCIAGTWGHCIVKEISERINLWEKYSGKEVDYIYKGLNPHTEHFSAFEAQIPLDHDDSTKFYVPMNLLFSNNIIVFGEALSHCVLSSLESLVKVVDPKVITLVTDATMNVPLCEELGEAGLKKLISMGMNAKTTEEVLSMDIIS